MAVFVERELVARRGRKRVPVRIRVHAPRRDPRGWPSWECAFDVTANGQRLRPGHKLLGADGLQALLLAVGFIALQLERYENDTGMRIEPWEWHDLWALRPNITMPGTRERAAAMRAVERKRAADAKQLTRSSSRTSAARRAPAPRAKSAPRKAPRRRRSAPRAS